MMKAAAIYLAIILAITGVITGLPMAIWNGSDKAAETPKAEAEAEAPAVKVVASAPAAEAPKVEEEAPVVAAAAVVAEPAAKPEPTVSAAALITAVKETAAPMPERAAQAPLAKPIVRGGTSGLEQTTAAILTELAIVDDVPVVSEQDATLKAMSENALSGLLTFTGKATETSQRMTLETIVTQALREGQNDDYIHALVNEAAGSGQISVPSALVTSDGQVDTAVLLNSLVSQAKTATGSAQQIDPNAVIAGGQGVEVYALSTASGIGESHRFYTVLPGDSLGAISVKFYGDISHYSKIFEANRAILSSPDRLNVGQRLVIPTI